MTDEPKAPRGGRRTRPVTVRMDIDVLARLQHHAPLERRSVGNLLQKLAVEGLDRLDDEEAIREIIRNQRRLMRDLKPGEARRVLERQRVLLRRRAGVTGEALPPLPPSLRQPPRPPRRRGRT